MNEISYTLLADGSSDRALIPILTWLLQQHYPEYAIQAEWADLSRVPNKPRRLPGRIKCSLELYPCDILFIHRDAEREARESRLTEIDNALTEIEDDDLPDTVRVIPVRMQEAWLLFNEIAIRKAAGNPNGRGPLALPPLRRVERLPDPKTILYNFLRQASGLTGRRLTSFRNSFHASLVAEYINDFSPLRALTAFQALEIEIEALQRT